MHFSPKRYVADHRPERQVDERHGPVDEACRASAAALVADRAIEGAHARERGANLVVARERHQDIAQHARVGDGGPRDGQGEHLRAQRVVHPVEHAEVRRAQAPVEQRERERVDARVCHQHEIILADDVRTAAKQPRDVEHRSHVAERHHFRSPSRLVTESGKARSEKKSSAELAAALSPPRSYLCLTRQLSARLSVRWIPHSAPNEIPVTSRPSASPSP